MDFPNFVVRFCVLANVHRLQKISTPSLPRMPIHYVVNLVLKGSKKVVKRTFAYVAENFSGLIHLSFFLPFYSFFKPLTAFKLNYIMPPMPGLPAGIAGSGAGLSAMTHSVVRNMPAIEAAFSRATRVTLAGSMTPALKKFSYSSVRAL